MKCNKMDIDWQIKRIRLKSLSTYNEKCDQARQFVLDNPTDANKYRVCNYLKGLSMAYKGNDRQYILDFSEEVFKLDTVNIENVSLEFKQYDNNSLALLKKDLFNRSKKWLLSGYRHEDQISFLKELLLYLGDASKLAELNMLVDSSYKIKNSHKFIF